MAFASPLGSRTSALLLFASEDVVWGSSAGLAGFSSTFVLFSGADKFSLVSTAVRFFSCIPFSTDSSKGST